MARSREHKRNGTALKGARVRPAVYSGAHGSRRNDSRRGERRRQEGVTTDQGKRIHAPIGLDIGGSSAGEIAVSVVAQLISTRNKRLSGEPAD